MAKKRKTFSEKEQVEMIVLRVLKRICCDMPADVGSPIWDAADAELKHMEEHE